MAFRIILVLAWILLLQAISAKDSCPLQNNNCYCSFSDDADDADSENEAASAETKSYAMAVAAGALSPLVVAGAGMGMWKLVTMKKDMMRSDSMLSHASEPPDYSSRRGSTSGVSRTVSVMNSEDEMTFSNSRTGSTADLTHEDEDTDTGQRPHPSHNWGSNNPYPGSEA